MLKNLPKFTRKHVCQSFYFNEGPMPEARKFIKKRTLAQGFSSELSEIFKNTYFYRTPTVAVSLATNVLLI